MNAGHGPDGIIQRFTEPIIQETGIRGFTKRFKRLVSLCLKHGRIRPEIPQIDVQQPVIKPLNTAGIHLLGQVFEVRLVVLKIVVDDHKPPVILIKHQRLQLV